MRLLALFIFLTISINSHAWTSIAFGKQTNYVYAYTQANSKIDAEAKALEGCAKRDNDCVINLSTTGKDTLIALVRYEGGIYTASGNNLHEVENTALANCRKASKGCYVQQLYWDGVGYIGGIATVNNENIIATLYSTNDADIAKQRALDKCKSISNTPEHCKSDYFNDSAYIAHAKSNTKDDEYEGFAVAETKDVAEKRALSECEKNGKRKCAVFLSYRSAYINPAPEIVTKRITQLNKAYNNKQAVKPKSTPNSVLSEKTNINRTSCQNSCHNGSCIRTFPDGKSEKWQAAKTFNPLTNNWEFDINSNPCGV